MSKNYDTQIKKLDGSQVEITGEIPADVFESERKAAVKKLGEQVSIDGFRKGKVPEDILVKKIGDMALLEEMAQNAIAKAYPEIIKKHAVDAIGRPEVNITKLAKENPLAFTIKTAVMPEITLPEYEKIAKAVEKIPEKIEITDQELDEALLSIRQMRAHQKMHEDGVEHHEHDHTKLADKDLPPVDDAWVKEIGQFENVEDFKKKLKENIKMEKTGKEREKRRIKIIEGIIEKTDTEVPQVLIDSELGAMLGQLRQSIAQAGMEFEQYLEQAKKTIEDLRKEWLPEAKKRATMLLVINKIATNEKIGADKERTDFETKMILDHNKDADPDAVRAHVESVLTNQKVFEYLESL